MEKTQKKIAAVVMLVENQLAQLARGTVETLGYRCLTANDAAEALAIMAKTPVDLVVSRVRESAQDFAFFDQAAKLSPHCRWIAVIDDSLEEYFPELLVKGFPHNLIADNQPLDLHELGATIRKLLNGDIFGIDKYGIPVHETIRLTASDQKYPVIEKIRDFYLQAGVQERIVRNVELILNELLMNAIFDAPVDPGGHKPYSNVDRGASFQLQDKEQPEVQYGLDHGKLAVSVSDQFGGFRKETFFTYVHRCFSEKSILEGPGKGAGMGLFMVFKSLNQMVINVAPGKKTEVIALIDYTITMRELKKRRHSFHHFQVEGR
ncbi:MAG: hypothetical protein U1F66_13545 [bacterium]